MDLIKEIHFKYSNLVSEVEKKLEKLKRDEQEMGKLYERNVEKSTINPAKTLSYDEALAHNTALLKSLEMAKALLRSRSTFSPVEQILEKAIENYKWDLEKSSADAIEEVQSQDSEQSTGNENIYELVEKSRGDA